jgi:NADH dehydrogenase
VDPKAARVVLVEAGDTVLAPFPEPLRRRARHDLERLGVDVRLRTLVTGIDRSGLDVRHEDRSGRIEASTKIWAAGVQASPLGRMLADQSRATVDRAGRVSVRPDCTLPGHPEVFVVGDLMGIDDLPGVAEVAMQSGMHAARTIRHRLSGRQTGPFHYVDMGSMAYVGRGRAVVDFRGLKLSGFLGWLMWLAVHLTFLTGFTNRFAALLNWSMALMGVRRVRILNASDLGCPSEAHDLPPLAGGG